MTTSQALLLDANGAVIAESRDDLPDIFQFHCFGNLPPLYGYQGYFVDEPLPLGDCFRLDPGENDVVAVGDAVCQARSA
jgi:hypothetical protein